MLSLTLSGVIFTVSPVASLPLNFFSSLLQPAVMKRTHITAKIANIRCIQSPMDWRYTSYHPLAGEEYPRTHVVQHMDLVKYGTDESLDHLAQRTYTEFH